MVYTIYTFLLIFENFHITIKFFKIKNKMAFGDCHLSLPLMTTNNSFGESPIDIIFLAF